MQVKQLEVGKVIYTNAHGLSTIVNLRSSFSHGEYIDIYIDSSTNPIRMHKDQWLVLMNDTPVLF